MSDFVFLVCGLGRCGSSLAMQMLHAGGYRTSGDHPAYEDDIALLPNRGTSSLWQRHIGGAVKLLDPHVNKLPSDVPFRAIWLDREHGEQAKSQIKFAAWSMGLTIDRSARRKLQASYRRETPAALAALRRAGAGPVGFLTFEKMLARPHDSAMIIRDAVGGDLDIEAMVKVVVARAPECFPGMLEERLSA